MADTMIDSDFVSTRYGVLRVAQFVLCILCLIMEEVSNCWARNYGFLQSVSVYGLLFSILVLVMFCVAFHHTLENYINLPLTLMLNEIIICVFFMLAGILVLVNLCSGAAKLGGIFTGILAIITGVTFGSSARLSYDWFATGSQSLTI